jgi:RNA polymerase sigma factor (sigma-70 family)
MCSIMENTDLDRLRAGDPALWRTIGCVYRSEFLYYALKNPDICLQDAEDAFQDALIKLWSVLQSGDLISLGDSLHNYTMRLARNQLIDNWRKKITRKELFNISAIAAFLLDDNEPFSTDLMTARLAKVLSLLPLLSEDERKLFWLCLKGKCTMNGIASKLDLNGEGHASKRKFDLIAKLKKMVQHCEL